MRVSYAIASAAHTVTAYYLVGAYSKVPSILRPDFADNSKIRRRRWVKRIKRGGPPQPIVLGLLGGKHATLRGLSVRTGLTIPSLSKILSGKVKHYSASTAQMIAHALGVSTDTFLAVLNRYVCGPASNRTDGGPNNDICRSE
jgi:hypothetical protein